MATRRSLLARCGQVTAAGALLGVAGCVDRSASGSGGETDTEPETDEPAATPTAEGAAGGRPDFGGWLDDANGFDGEVMDATGQETVTVTVGAGEDAFAFDPPAVHVDSGTTVEFEWTGEGGAHDVVSAESGPLDSGSAVGGEGVHYEHTFEEDGVFDYTCLPHQSIGMLGSVVVGTDYPTTDEPFSDGDEGAGEAVPDDEQGHYLDDANGYDGGVPTDRRGQNEVTVRVGAGEQGYAFEPATALVDPGTTVRWEWTGDGGAHNVVARDGAFDSGSPEAGDDVSFGYTVTESGSHMYGCLPHEALGMKGAIAVAPEQEAGDTATAVTLATDGGA
ncbi:halocyanin domain-containing protein [Halorientalis pallida]|uniref:halocyanin domain-containing protein n=1 Tax=Halorientalis pallida TaxID=2479928 RepID=UPI00187D3723|nr:halocyanin domain-containing protein [Halorientalis pallida]